jgi:SAM-dependent methyltransferase
VSERRGVEQRLVFDEVAELYDRARPRYPEAFVDVVCARAALSPGARILEVGCGTGLATRGFAERGYSMLCLEPGPRLAEVARGHLARFPDVTVECTSFEAWPGERHPPFDLVLAAQSFHWVDPEIGFPKAAAALRAGGGLAIIANLPQPGISDLRDALDRVYARFGPDFSAHAHAPGSVSKVPLLELFEESREFGDVERVSHPWSARYKTEAYLELMQTQSDHRMLAPEALRDLVGLLRVAVDAHGGSVRVDYEARLLFARRVSSQ